jgi:hypothetical protein
MPDGTPMIDAPTAPTKPGQWTIAQIEAALSRPLPPQLLQQKKKGGATLDFIPWYIANRILGKYAPGWSGRVTHIQAIGNELILTYSLTVPTCDGAITREATGSESLDLKGYGEVAANAESQAFRRCCARFGLGLYLYDRK